MPGRASLWGERRRKITLWWGSHQTKAPPPALVLLTLQSPWTTQLTCTWVWAANTESTEDSHSLGNILSQSEFWVRLRWSGWLAEPFLFEHLFINMVYGGCSSSGCWGWLSVAVVSCVLHAVVLCWPPHPGLPAGACQPLGLTQNLSLKWNFFSLKFPFSTPSSFSCPSLVCFMLTINFFTHFFFPLTNVFMDDVVTWANICQEPSHLLSCFEAFECLALRNILQKFIFPGSKL